MRIHIHSHLEKYEIISQLKKIIIEYSKGGLVSDGSNSFENYFYERSLDPVRKFLMLCISEDRIGETDYETLINYYTAKFFSLRGTLKIFDLLEEIKKILGISILNYSYSVISLTVDFEEIETFDMNLFNTSASEFFKALLYYQDYIDTIKTMKLDLVSGINITLSGGIVSYTEHEVTKEVLEDEN